MKDILDKTTDFANDTIVFRFPYHNLTKQGLWESVPNPLFLAISAVLMLVAAVSNPGWMQMALYLVGVQPFIVFGLRIFRNYNVIATKYSLLVQTKFLFFIYSTTRVSVIRSITVTATPSIYPARSKRVKIAIVSEECEPAVIPNISMPSMDDFLDFLQDNYSDNIQHPTLCTYVFRCKNRDYRIKAPAPPCYRKALDNVATNEIVNVHQWRIIILKKLSLIVFSVVFCGVWFGLAAWHLITTGAFQMVDAIISLAIIFIIMFSMLIAQAIVLLACIKKNVEISTNDGLLEISNLQSNSNVIVPFDTLYCCAVVDLEPAFQAYALRIYIRNKPPIDLFSGGPYNKLLLIENAINNIVSFRLEENRKDNGTGTILEGP